jgi:hypothetical protein
MSREAPVLECYEGEDTLGSTVRQRKVELVVVVEVEVAEVEAPKRAMLRKLQHWLRLEKPRKAILPESCCCQV